MPRRPGAAIDLGRPPSTCWSRAPSGRVWSSSTMSRRSSGSVPPSTGPARWARPAGRRSSRRSARYVERARALGRRRPIVMGTEPLRRLTDATRIVAEVSAGTGAPLAVLEHEEEALLTLVGLTAGRAVTATSWSSTSAADPASSSRSGRAPRPGGRGPGRRRPADPPDRRSRPSDARAVRASCDRRRRRGLRLDADAASRPRSCSSAGPRRTS